MGFSSTPGSHTMMNCPGLQSIDSLKKNDFWPLPSCTTSLISSMRGMSVLQVSWCVVLKLNFSFKDYHGIAADFYFNRLSIKDFYININCPCTPYCFTLLSFKMKFLAVISDKLVMDN